MPTLGESQRMRIPFKLRGRDPPPTPPQIFPRGQKEQSYFSALFVFQMGLLRPHIWPNQLALGLILCLTENHARHANISSLCFRQFMHATTTFQLRQPPHLQRLKDTFLGHFRQFSSSCSAVYLSALFLQFLLTSKTTGLLKEDVSPCLCQPVKTMHSQSYSTSQS